MNKSANQYSLCQSEEKHIKKYQISPNPLLIVKESDLLRETQNNCTSLMLNLQKTPVRSTSILKSRDQVLQLHKKEGRNTHTGKSSIISDITNRLNSLEMQLNTYQSKANKLKNSLQKTLSPKKNKVLLMSSNHNQNQPIISLGTNNSEYKQNNNYYIEQLYNGRYYKQKEIDEEPIVLHKGYDSHLKKEKKSKELYMATEQTLTLTTIQNNNQNQNLKGSLKELLSRIEELNNINNQFRQDVCKLKEDHRLSLFTTQSQLIDIFNIEKNKYIKNTIDKLNAFKEETDKLKGESRNNVKQIEQMQKEIDSLNKSNNNLISSLTESNLQRDQSLLEINTKLTPQITVLLQKNKELESILQSTKEQKESNYSSHIRQIQELETQMLKQKNEVNLIAKDYFNNKNDLDRSREMNEKLVKEIESKTNNYFNVKSQLSVLNQQIKSKDKTISTLTNSINSLKETMEGNKLKYKKEMSSIMKELKDIKTKNDILVKKMSSTDSNNRIHSKQISIEEYINKRKEDEKEIKLLNDIILEYKTESGEYVNEKRLLNEEIAIYKQERLKKEEINKKYITNQEEIDNLQKVIEEMKLKEKEEAKKGNTLLNQQINELNNVIRIEKENNDLTIKELKERINQCNEENEQYKNKQASLSLELTQTLNKLNDSESSKTHKINILELKIKEINNEYDYERNQHNKEMKYYKKENEFLKGQNDNCNQIINTLNNQIDKNKEIIQLLELTRNKLANEQKDFVVKIDNEIDQLHKENTIKSNEYIGKINELERKVEQLKDRSNIKDNEIDNIKQLLLESDSKNEELMKTIDKVKKNNEMIEEEYEIKENNLAKSNQIKEKHKIEIDELKNALHDNSNDIKNKDKEIEDLFNKVIEYKKQISSLMSEKNLLKLRSNNDIIVKNVNRINKILNILLDESITNEERNKVKEFLLKQIQNNKFNDSNNKESNINNNQANDIEEEDSEDDAFQLEDENFEEINTVPGQRNSTLKKKGFSTSLLK